VADEQACGGWQGQQALDGVVQLRGIPARKVGARRAHVGQEQGVADEDRILDLVGHVGRRVAGHVQGRDRQATDLEALAVGQQAVELAAVGQEAALEVEDAAEHLLHRADVRADGDLPAQVVADVLRAREVVGMGVGFQDPLHLPALGAHVVDDAVGRGAGQRAGFGLEIQHRVDHRDLAAGGVGQHIAHRAGDVVVEGFDVHGVSFQAPMRGNSRAAAVGCINLLFNIIYKNRL